MAIRRVVLTAIGLAVWSSAMWLPINFAWGRPVEMAVYGALYGGIGVFYGFCAARFWFRVHEVRSFTTGGGE